MHDMNVAELRDFVEPFLASKSESKTTLIKYRSYLNTYLKFLETSEYEEMADESISSYTKKYLGGSNVTTRENIAREFRDYVLGQVKGDAPMIENEVIDETTAHEPEPGAEQSTELEPLPEPTHEPEPEPEQSTEPEPLLEPTHETKPELIADSEATQESKAGSNMHKSEAIQVPVQALKKRGRKPKPENENRTQISANIDNGVYAGLKSLAFVSQQPLSDLIAEILKAFYEDNYEAISASVEVMRQSELAKLKIKYHR